ncbi:DNA polymerase III subunit alpha [Gracilibacillus sp. S3-1-1]|uniref:DNA polymerase III subunit alpha n=1 Tax=Gracilibacillus pellucidus TaxID=3095368 RepID=A0ACC6M719_9BACI|nr:DNA polymerase III subunit alpha [Gracilibacillus sp. S3-1-1]MDX8046703.1 DNA polymerase III subunit alpha [Gracilibacillus sp. S3-1-1]
MSGFAALQVKSGYSFMNSTIQIAPLIQKAKDYGYQHLALTDEGTMYGAISFYQACKNAGINPIIGLKFQVEINDQVTDIISLAKNKLGYQHLLQISTDIQHDKKITLSMLGSFDHALITIVPAEQWQLSEIASNLQVINDQTRLQQLFLGINEQMITYRQQLEPLPIRKVALSDVRYLNVQDMTAFSSLQAIAQGIKWNSSMLENVQGTHLQAPEELESAFYAWPELLTEANNLANMCQIELQLGKTLLPKFPVPNEMHADRYLEEMCHRSLELKYEVVTTEIKERLNYELDVIQSMGFSDYFLIVWDFVQYAKDNQIMVGPGRGSAAGSLVAYLLGITDVDPIQYNLLFERFLNPERVSMPDIDIDFSDEKRDQVIQYVVEKYGSDHVAQIITFGTFAARSLLRELFKVLDIHDNDQAYILKSLPKDSNSTIAALLKQSPDLTEYVKQSEQLKRLFKIANQLEGLPRHASTHAAGVIISEDRLTEHVATLPAHSGIELTQYPMKDLEKIGLLKMDFLGLRNLTLIEKILKQIEFHYKISISLENIPFDDVNTFHLLQKGETNGVFQLESQGMQNVLKELKPTNFEDIVAVNALYRPGPMEFIPTYIERKHQKRPIPSVHPDVDAILQTTYGVLLYQEQIIQTVHQMAGFTYGEADILRRAVSKKDKQLLMDNKQKFIHGSLQNGYTKKTAEEVFDWIVRFSNYGFNRSHAVAYSVIAYQLAYLKANYPLAFFVEMLSMHTGNTEKIQLYLREAKGRGITILPPSINESIGKFKIEKGGIRLGLTLIKGIGYQVVQPIIDARKNQLFRNLFDFCLKVPMKQINRSVMEALILAGTFDELHDNRATLLASLDEAIEQGELFKEFDDQLQLLEGDLALDVSYTETEPLPAIKQLMMEKEVIGFYVSRHPLAQVRDNIRQYGYIQIQQAYSLNHRMIKMAVVVQGLKVIRTKKGESMAFATLSDESGELDAVLFPQVYRQVNHWLEEDGFVFVEGKLEERNGKKQLIINVIEPYQLEEKQLTTDSVYIKIAEKSDALLEKIEELATKYPGASTIYLYQEEPRQLFKLSSRYNVDTVWNVVKELKQYFGDDNVVVKHE